MERILLFDRQDRPLGELSPNDVFSLIRTERVNGEHSLKITTTKVLQQGWRILVCDSRQKWREFVVYGTDALHDSGEKPFGDYYCVWSLQPDLMGTRVSAMPGVQNPCTAAVALAAALGGTLRWSVGTVTNTNTGGASMYDTDGWSALSILLSNWGGEIDTTIEVGLDGVVARKVDLYALQGDQDADGFPAQILALPAAHIRVGKAGGVSVEPACADGGLVPHPEPAQQVLSAASERALLLSDLAAQGLQGFIFRRPVGEGGEQVPEIPRVFFRNVFPVGIAYGHSRFLLTIRTGPRPGKTRFAGARRSDFAVITSIPRPKRRYNRKKQAFRPRLSSDLHKITGEVPKGVWAE